MEYCEFGDLHKYMQDHGRLPEQETREIAAQLAEGLQFMHSENFAHRDLKPRVSIDFLCMIEASYVTNRNSIEHLDQVASAS